MKFNNTLLVAEQNNYATKIINECISYDLDNWHRNLLHNFVLENWLFGATIVKNRDKSTFVCSSYGLAFDGACSWRVYVMTLLRILTYLVLIIVHVIEIV